MKSTDKTIIAFDIIIGIICVISGNIGIPKLLQFLINCINSKTLVELSTEYIAITAITLLITVITYSKIKDRLVKFFVVIGLFIPVLLMLLSFLKVLPAQKFLK